MNQERKISALRNLLERVQKRAAAPRVVSTVGSVLESTANAPAVAAPAASASFPVAASQAATPPPMAISAPPAQPKATSARPGSSTLPLNFSSRPEAASFREAAEIVAEKPAERVSALADSNPATPASRPLYDPSRSSAPEIETDEGPPSAPRLREGAEDIEEEDEPIADEREIEEPQLKTPPPESGRQHVTPSPTATLSEPDEDISITVAMEESEAPPPVSPAPPEVSIPLSASRPDIPEVSGAQPRLALVSEPEIELHGMTPLAAIVEPLAAPKPPSVAQPGAFPSPGYTHPLAKTAQSPIAATKPSASAPVSAPPFIEAAPPTPPVRMMAQQLRDASGKPLPPVEVWASSFAPGALRGEIATFVGQNANFEPKSFGELVRASIALGEEKP